MALILREASAADRINAGAGLYVEPVEGETGFVAATKAAFIEENSIAQWYADLEHQTNVKAVEGYDQYKDIPEDLYDVSLDSWRGVESPEEMEGRIGEIRDERERRRIMSTSGWGTFVGSMGGYIFSPETIPELLMTGGAGGWRGVGRAAGTAVLAELAHESVMHEESYTRTVQESMLNIGLTAFAAAGLGATINAAQKRAFTKELVNDLKEIAEPTATVKDRPELASVGAAQVDAGAEEIVNKPWLKWKRLGPVRSMAHATSRIAQYGMNTLVEHSYQPGKTFKGIAKDVAFETRANRKVATIVRDVADNLNKGYRKWADEQQMSFAQRKDPRNWAAYQRELHRAMISGDRHTSDAIMGVSKALRSHYDDVYSYAKTVRERKGLDGDDDFISLDDFTTKFAESYVPRRYNKAAIRRDEVNFKAKLKEGFRMERAARNFDEAVARGEAEGKSIDDYLIPPEEIKDPKFLKEWISINKDAEATYQRIVHGYDQDVYMGAVGKGQNAMKERKVPLRDEDMFEAGWLESDMQAMTINYINRLYKPAAMIDETGDAEMKGFIDNLNSDYARLRDEAKTDKERKALEKEQKGVRESFETWRDRFYGRTTISTSQHAEALNDILRTMRNLNVARLMGMVTFISAGDVARANLTTVMARELGEWGPGLVDAVKTAKISKREFQRLGIAHEMASYVRTGKILDDAGMMEGSSKAVEVTNLMSRGLMRVSGLAWWTDQMKLLAAAYTQNDLVHKMRNFSRLGEKSRTSMAQLGIDESWAARFNEEMAGQAARSGENNGINVLGKADHGYDGDGYVLDWQNFQDQELAEHLQNIIFRESERNIVTPAAGDIPKLLPNDELNKTLFQFQSFLFGAGTSVTVNLGRRMRQADPKVAVLLSNMMMMGLFGVTLRNAAYGRMEEMEEWSPQDYAMNAFDYSSIAPIFMMGFNHVNMMTGNALTNALGMETMSRMTNRPVMSLLGPSAGLAEDALNAASSVAGLTYGEEFTPADVRRIRRLMPWNNLAWTAWLTTQGQKQLEEMAE